MRKSKVTKIMLSMALTLALVGSTVACGSNAGDSALTDQAAVREAGVPADGMVYIEPEMVSLADSLSGTADSQAAAKAAFDIVNVRRQEAGLGTLTWNSGLEQASFSHTRPDGSDWWTVNSNLMYGENLAKGYASADAAVAAWLDSPTHKANIMDVEFTSGAIAIHVNSNGQWYWAQEFGY